MSPLFVGSGSSGSEGRSDRLGLPTGTSDPGTAEAGDLYYKTDTNKIRYYDGSAWADLASGGGGGGVTGYTIDSSLRFDSASSATLSRTLSVGGDRKTWTLSGWAKRSKLGIFSSLFGAFFGDSSRYYIIRFTNTDALQVFGGNYTTGSSATTNHNITTSSLYRDTSAWYHIVVAYDTTQTIEADRVKIYVNGNRVTSFSSAAYPAINTETFVNATNSSHHIGDWGENVHFYDGYMADIHFIDGSALAPTAFGEFDATTGVWNPIEYTGTYPGNSFHLDFSDNSTAAALGTDTSGNSNTWSVSNISVTAGAGNDSLVDSPTNYGTDTGAGGEVRGNYATLNPLKTEGLGTLSNGNLDFVQTTAGNETLISTQSLSNGSWYWEVTLNSSTNNTPGVAPITETSYPGAGAGFGWGTSAGSQYLNGSTLGAATATTSDIIGFGFNSSTFQLKVYKNGVETAFSPVTVTSGFEYFAAFGTTSANSAAATFNFGQRPFAYQNPGVDRPSADYKALCTTNLPEPTGVVAQPNTAMDVRLDIGSGGSQTRTFPFSPDLIWLKMRSAAGSHYLWDTVRGLGDNELRTNGTDAEGFNSAYYTISSATNGYTISQDSIGNEVNYPGNTYVTWAWDAGDSTVSNPDGSITTSVRANATAGFSVLTATTGSAGTSSYGHGLGVAPSLVIAKDRGVGSWAVYHKSTGVDQYLFLNSTGAAGTSSGVWGSGPTSTTFSLLNNSLIGFNRDIVAYCFAPVEGYSSFGSYVGNGSSDGPFVYTGFRPRWVLRKNINIGGTGYDWVLIDSARDANNLAQNKLYPNFAGNENVNSDNSDSGATSAIDILSNGFKVRASNARMNGSSQIYIYAAFAESPFQYARAR